MSANGDAHGLTAETRRAVAQQLRIAAELLHSGVSDDADGETLLVHLGALRAVFDAVDAGNAAQGKEPGPLRGYRTFLFHQLADQRVPRDRIAETAGVSANAVGFAFKGERRGRPGRPAADDGPAPAIGELTNAGPAGGRRRPRPT